MQPRGECSFYTANTQITLVWGLRFFRANIKVPKKARVENSEIHSSDGDEAKDIGKIIKEAPHDFEDLVQQGMTDADNFTMSYPKDIDPRLKAAMAAALLLIDYQFFEDEGNCYCNPFRCVCGYKCCVCSMCGCLLEWGICFGRRGGDGPCCFDCCWCPCCP